jgi:hypothetical protein
MRREVDRGVLKVLLIVVGLAVLSLGASIVLSDPDPVTLPVRAGRWLAARSSWSNCDPTLSMPPKRSRSDLFTCAHLGSLLESTIVSSTCLTDPISCATERQS